MGLKLTGVLDFELPVLIKEIPQGDSQSLFLYPMLLGAVFALAGTPCSTPILAGIMAFCIPFCKHTASNYNAFLVLNRSGLNINSRRFLNFTSKKLERILQFF